MGTYLKKTEVNKERAVFVFGSKLLVSKGEQKKSVLRIKKLKTVEDN